MRSFVYGLLGGLVAVAIVAGVLFVVVGARAFAAPTPTAIAATATMRRPLVMPTRPFQFDEPPLVMPTRPPAFGRDPLPTPTR